MLMMFCNKQEEEEINWKDPIKGKKDHDLHFLLDCGLNLSFSFKAQFFKDIGCDGRHILRAVKQSCDLSEAERG